VPASFVAPDAWASPSGRTVTVVHRDGRVERIRLAGCARGRPRAEAWRLYAERVRRALAEAGVPPHKADAVLAAVEEARRRDLGA